MRKLSARDYWERAEAFGEDFEGSPCMVLPNAPDREGYVSVGRAVPGRSRRAHRLIYEELIGPIPPGKDVDHRCASTNNLRACVNPWHLEPVTCRENLMRGKTHAARNAAKTECLNGHPLSGENLAVIAGKRQCRTCARERGRIYDAKRKPRRRHDAQAV
jgi:HNH endonuclease